MQAVAGVLGVDPKALNYHVGDREGLRGLVALDVFESELRRVELPADGDWRVVARSFAGAIRDAYLKVGVLAASFHLPAATGLAVIACCDAIVATAIGRSGRMPLWCAVS